MIGCELAAEVIRSSGKLRLQVVGSSMLPVLWPGDLLSVCKHDDAPPSPGDVVVFSRAGKLITHRVVEVRSQETANLIQDSRFKIQDPESQIPRPESRVASPESRIEFVTRGDSVKGNDAPVSRHELLGRVTSIERGSRQFTPRQSIFSRMASWIFSRSDFATRAALKASRWAQAVRDSKLKIQDSKYKLEDSRFGIQDLT